MTVETPNRDEIEELKSLLEDVETSLNVVSAVFADIYEKLNRRDVSSDVQNSLMVLQGRCNLLKQTLANAEQTICPRCNGTGHILSSKEPEK